jgi:superoxide dismutase, Fe-Mn family
MEIHSITPGELQFALGSDTPPVLLDVRRAPVFEQAEALIEGAAWRDPAAVDDWGQALPMRDRTVVVYCVHGHQVSQGCASRLRALGRDARFLEGGIEAWQAAGGALAQKA